MAQKSTILFVEDDPGVREVLSDFLPGGEFRSLVAANGYEAMRILSGEDVDVMVTNLVMDGMRGVELARQATLMRPTLHVIFMTGYLSRAEEAQQVAPVLFKPVRPGEMESTIRQHLEGRASQTHELRWLRALAQL